MTAYMDNDTIKASAPDIEGALRQRELWLGSDTVPERLKDELRHIVDEAELADRFYCRLSFGTGGIRGLMGAGTNRINTLMVAAATQGFAAYLKEQGPNPSVCIAYDTRNMSREFALEAARVFSLNRVKVHIFAAPRPTPMLSFAVRYFGASGGVVITASHNPKQYNGYKVYGPSGVQITDDTAKGVAGHIERYDILRDIPQGEADAAYINDIGGEFDVEYIGRVKRLTIRKELLRDRAGELSVLYSPLFGTGRIPVWRTLAELGCGVALVAAQAQEDGEFPGVEYPNPEDEAAFGAALRQAGSSAPDIILATDPDCDRIGVLASCGGQGYVRLTGNQIGALLCHYIICSEKELNGMPEAPAVIKTIVTSDFIKPFCAENGVTVAETLTGFKYIGELAEKWSETGEHSMLFGFEESYGYLAGDFVRDKDAVIAAALICELALYYKTQGMTLSAALEALYAQYGYYLDGQISRTFYGAEGKAHIAWLMEYLRNDCMALIKDEALYAVEDYLTSTRIICASGASEKLYLPGSNVIKLIFADGCWLVLRPSGTEPKIKLYIGVQAKTAAEADSRMERLRFLADTILSQKAAK